MTTAEQSMMMVAVGGAIGVLSSAITTIIKAYFDARQTEKEAQRRTKEELSKFRIALIQDDVNRVRDAVDEVTTVFEHLQHHKRVMDGLVKLRTEGNLEPRIEAELHRIMDEYNDLGTRQREAIGRAETRAVSFDKVIGDSYIEWINTASMLSQAVRDKADEASSLWMDVRRLGGEIQRALREYMVSHR